MIKKSITPQDAVNVLNEALALDKDWIASLWRGFECNDRLAEHESIQVWFMDGKYAAGIVGLLNGIFGKDENGYGPICAVMDERELIKFDLIENHITKG